MKHGVILHVLTALTSCPRLNSFFVFASAVDSGAVVSASYIYGCGPVVLLCAVTGVGLALAATILFVGA